jgi:hypothetical protein
MHILHVTRVLARLVASSSSSQTQNRGQLEPIQINPTQHTHLTTLNHTMVGFKRGGFRGGASGAYKKSYTKKRAASDDEDGAAPTSKKNKGDEDEPEDSTPFVPELKTNDDKEKYISVGMRRCD